MAYSLQKSVQGVADATGQVILQLQPQRWGESWAVWKISVQNSSSPTVPVQAAIYSRVQPPPPIDNGPTVTPRYGFGNSAAFIDSTDTGQQDVNQLDTPLYLESGETMYAQWLNATPGSISMLIVEGQASR